MTVRKSKYAGEAHLHLISFGTLAYLDPYEKLSYVRIIYRPLCCPIRSPKCLWVGLSSDKRRRAQAITEQLLTDDALLSHMDSEAWKACT
jgi:hypothetical protein